jgi:hypothetical protein
MEFPVGSCDHLPRAVLKTKENRALRCHFDLRIKSCKLQFLSPLQQLLVQRVTFRKSMLEKWCGHSVQSGIKWVHQDQAFLGKQTGEEFSESAGVCFIRTVTLGQVLGEQIASAVRKDIRRLSYERLNLCAERNSSYRSPALLRHR